jgi:hypothetical protein
LKTTTSLRNSLPFAAALVGSILSISTASATTIADGQANFTGNVTVNTGGVFFGGTLNVPAGSVETGGYNGLSGGTIKDLLGPPQTGVLATPITQFITFNTATGPVFFDLTTIAAGVGSNAACGSNTVGNMCTPTGSPFTLTQLASGVGIQLSLSGVAYTGTSATGSDATVGIFTTQNTIPGTITSILAAVVSPSGITNSYSATFSSTAPTVIPEPGTYMLLGLGLITVASIRKRTRKA